MATPPLIALREVFDHSAERCCYGESMCDWHANAMDELAEFDVQAASDASARAFDARIALDSMGGAMPDSRWPPTALMRQVSDSLMSPPWFKPLERSIRVTSALAHLGELGIPPDAVMRTYFGPRLWRSVLTEATAAWVDVRMGEIEERLVPWQLSDWFMKLDAVGIDPSHPFPRVMGDVMESQLKSEATAWVAEAAASHLASWRIADFLPVKTSDDDLILPGGREATIWILDRFSRTSTSDWSHSSLEWELAFAQEPEHTARTAGLSLELLNSRPASGAMATEALVRWRLGQVVTDEYAVGLSTNDLIEQLTSLVRRDDVSEALELAGTAQRLAPARFPIANAYAFCSIATDSHGALQKLSGLVPGNSNERALLAVNIASCHLRLGDLKSARCAINSAAQQIVDDTACLWKPSSLTTDHPVVADLPFADWVREATLLVEEAGTADGVLSSAP